MAPASFKTMAASIVLFFCISAASAADAPAKTAVPLAARSILPFAGSRIIAMGEASHGDERLLRERNRLVSELAAEHRISWVALETGLVEARLLDRFVRGGAGDAEAVAKRGFTSGFGNLSGNVGLLRELRKYNASQPIAEKIGIAGIDLSLGGPLDSAPTIVPVDCALDGVVDHSTRKRLHAAFAAAVIPGLKSTHVTVEQKATFHDLSRELAASMSDDASPDSRQCSRVVAQSARVFEAMPMQVEPGQIPNDAWVSVSQRDQVPDLLKSWGISCKAACMVPTGSKGTVNRRLFRIGISGDDEQVILPSSATFFIVMPTKAGS